MKAEDFSAWLSAIAGLSAEQRGKRCRRSRRGARRRGLPRRRIGRRGLRRKASGAVIGRTRLERAMSVWKARAVRIARPAKSSAGAARTDFCASAARAAAHVHALTRTPMAHLRKKERWLDHARAMIEGKSLAKTAALCGVHPTTAFRGAIGFTPRPSSDKPRSLRGIVEADETFILNSFKGRWSDLPRKARKRGGTARRRGLSDNIPVLVARDRKGATFDAVLPQVDGASVEAALAGVVTPSDHLIGDGGEAIAAFARQSRDSVPRRTRAGKAEPQGASPARQHRQRLPRPPQAVAQPLQRRRHQEPARSGWRRALETRAADSRR